MTIFVSGLWHLGCVTAACLSEHFRVIAHDLDSDRIEQLKAGVPPLHEPGMTDLIRRGIDRGALTFTHDVADAARADLVWLTYDTPVNERDESDVTFIDGAVGALLPHVKPGALLVVSSQVPAGFTKRMEALAESMTCDVRFAYLPENLRLGNALQIFRRPDRIVAGVRSDEDADLLGPVLAPFTTNVIWMSPESAEMTKHAINAFLATSITFINEIAGICENAGADVKAVEAGLKSDERIGPRAALTAGSGFAGGTLARDLRTLSALGRAAGIATPIADAVLLRNEAQQGWTERTLLRRIGSARGKRIALLGLTYKPGTDTLRRSMAVDLASRLHTMGAVVAGYDPAIRALPRELAGVLDLAADAESALADSDAAIVATACPEFRLLRPQSFHGMKQRIVIDPQRYLEDVLAPDDSIAYAGVGLPSPPAERT